jgi:C4-dicarboxylate transporter DctQ subunit
MTPLTKWFSRGTEFIAAAMLATMFLTFLLQIFSRYVLQTPFGWTLELCLTLWIWIVFFGNAFIVRERDHVTFDIFYLAAPRRVRQILALISAGAIIVGMAWAFLPTLDWIDWLKIKKSATLKIPLRTVYSIYGVFMLVIILKYGWRFIEVIRKGPPDQAHTILPGDDQ